MLHVQPRPLPFIACALLMAVACTQPRRTVTPAPRAPVIYALSPSQGPAGTAYPIEVTITGMGFAPAGNSVRFGDIVIADLPSPNGVEIRFFAPKERPSTGEVPPFVLQPGHYAVTVTTPDGTSQPVLFELTRSPDA